MKKAAIILLIIMIVSYIVMGILIGVQIQRMGGLEEFLDYLHYDEYFREDILDRLRDKDIEIKDKHKL